MLSSSLVTSSRKSVRGPVFLFVQVKKNSGLPLNLQWWQMYFSSRSGRSSLGAFMLVSPLLGLHVIEGVVVGLQVLLAHAPALLEYLIVHGLLIQR